MQVRLAFAVSALVAAAPTLAATLGGNLGCGAPSLTSEDHAELQALSMFPSAVEAERGPVSIPVYWNTLTDNSGQGNLTASQIQEWMSVVNKGYAKTGFSFRLAGTRYLQDSAQFNTKGVDTAATVRLRDSLHVGNQRTLNIVTLNMLSAGYVGYATYPWVYRSEPRQDGVLIHYDLRPGSTDPNNNLGHVLIHEIGHWLGLLHVFSGSCDGDGDGVADTPPQKTLSRGCPTGKDSCPNRPGLDSIHNYLDYSDDVCLREFTPGQVARMKQFYGAYRA
ncbi:uncharacterized protein PFL1_02620 [Pseudozyma flocculosa PF-1]|uniref:Related to metalloprotease MEP1 n=2 Tax=Pseudozyma flocculosa TaxID=84751 RepID=A0A5C3EZJ2_9BASI|nr:uncharacterized protein PFL1_02620 [Pseudozyma flocculosa PF-1]EPQ29948.1 hypothetical protein PFL1_02620 [Pseudozyma flocculosa PF-1]SPO37260.1 related to metalloprotease MEP1 [Pseudozyma flocculosa]